MVECAEAGVQPVDRGAKGDRGCCPRWGDVRVLDAQDGPILSAGQGSFRACPGRETGWPTRAAGWLARA